MLKNPCAKKLFNILFIITGLITGYVFWGFLFGCSSTPKIIPSIVLSIDRNPTISFNSTAHRDATIKLQFQKIKFSEISMVYRDDIKSQSGLTYRNFLEITIPSNTDDTAVINISFKNDIPECDFTSFHLYLQAVSNDIKSNEIFISVFLVQQNLSDIFTQTDLGAFIISPTEPEILNKAIALNPKYNPNEFDNESLSIILISNQSAKLSCSDQDLWIGEVTLTWTISNTEDVNDIIKVTDLSEGGTHAFVEWPSFSDIIWRVTVLNPEHTEAWYNTSFWPYVNLQINAVGTTPQATVTGLIPHWKNSVTLSFLVENGA